MALPLQMIMRMLGMEIREHGEIFMEDGTPVLTHEDSTTMEPETRESIVTNLKNLKKASQKDREKVISQFRKGWEKTKKIYNPEEQERLQNEFNMACPELKLK